MDVYNIMRPGYEYLIDEGDKISWSRYRIDATMYDTEEEADNRRIELGLVMCGLGFGSRRINPK